MIVRDKSQVFSHVRRDEWASVAFGRPATHVREFERKGFFSISEIRKSKGSRITSFTSLVLAIAELGYHNHGYNLLFRGQPMDDKDRNGRTRLYATIYRPKGSRLTKPTTRKRFNALSKSIEALQRSSDKLGVDSVLQYYREYYMALLQHYQQASTPLLDLTSSIFVAASFALQKSNNGYLYVIGLPHIHGSISHYIDDSLVLVKLQNVCPPNALRPHLQEAYLVGKLPFKAAKEAEDNIARRLIGKYLLDNNDNRFWKGGFRRSSHQALFPKADDYLLTLQRILQRTG